jgi:hypothetical protein
MNICCTYVETLYLSTYKTLVRKVLSTVRIYFFLRSITHVNMQVKSFQAPVGAARHILVPRQVRHVPSPQLPAELHRSGRHDRSAGDQRAVF